MKNFKTYEEQLDSAQQHHGLVVEPRDEAISIITHVNYYRLRGYGIGLIQNNKLYPSGISIKVLYQLYSFDESLRSILFKIIEKVEVQLRSQLAYQLGGRYGPLGYLNPDWFQEIHRSSGIPIHEELIKKLMNEVMRQRNLPFVRHHFKKYDGFFPIWVAVEMLSFGNISSFYSVLSPSDRKDLADLYQTDPRKLSSWLLALLEIRNKCAHSNRIYNVPLKQSPALYKENKKYQTGSIHRLFPVVLVLCRMTKAHPFLHLAWNNFFGELQQLMAAFSEVIDLNCMGFPEDWVTVLSKYGTDRFSV